MNKYLISELTNKVMEANDLNTQYEFELTISKTGFRLTAYANNTTLHTCSSYKLASYERFLQHDGEESELNYAIAHMNNFIRWGEFSNCIRIALMDGMKDKVTQEYTMQDLAGYFNLSSDVAGVMENDKTKQIV